MKVNKNKGFDIDIVQGASEEDIKIAEEMATIKGGRMYCPNCKRETPIPVLRKDRKDEKGNTISGLRRWDKDEFVPRQMIFSRKTLLYSLRKRIC